MICPVPAVALRRWDRLSLRNKGLLLIAIPMLPLIGLALAIFVQMANQDRETEAVRRTLEIKAALADVLVTILRAESSVRGYVLTGNEAWLAPWAAAERDLPGQVAGVAAQLAAAGSAVNADELARLVEVRVGTLRDLRAHPPGSPPSEAVLERGHQAMDAVHAELARLHAGVDAVLAAHRERAAQFSRRTRALTIGAATFGAGVGAWALCLVMTGLTRRVRAVRTNAERLAGNEPLIGQPSESGDELGDLDRALFGAAALLEQRAKEAQLAKEELDRFFDLSLDMLCMSDMNGRFTRMNPAWEATLGWKVAELQGAPYYDFIHPDDRHVTKETADALARGGVVVSFVNRYRTRDGQYRWMSWKSVGLPDRDRIYGAVRDVTDEKRVEAELRSRAAELAAARLEADRANHAKTEFLSAMSHDLRTPLNAILGFAQLLKCDRLDREQEESVDQILAGGRHLLGLISEVIDIARVESGQLSLSPEAVAVADVVQRAAEFVQPLADARGITLRLDPMPPLAGLLADRQRVHQILLNFLANAVKYNREGGSIRVTVTGVAEDRYRIGVTDTGAGIPAEKLSRLFQPFERLGAEATGVEGTGLGLALARALAGAMGGAVGVDSTVDLGSTFWVELPAARIDEPALDPLPSKAAEEIAATAGLVLYIEDNQANTRLMTRILRQRPGVELAVAGTGESGLAAVRARRPDLLLLDLHLPDTTGEQVLWALWRDPETRGVPTVVLTADATPGLSQRLRAAGARALLTKPLDIARVLELVDRHLVTDDAGGRHAIARTA